MEKEAGKVINMEFFGRKDAGGDGVVPAGAKMASGVGVGVGCHGCGDDGLDFLGLGDDFLDGVCVVADVGKVLGVEGVWGEGGGGWGAGMSVQHCQSEAAKTD